jgi:two-component system response regulator GlrR
VPQPTLKEAREQLERTSLEVLRRANGNLAAARAAGRDRTGLYDLLRRHGLAPAELTG